MKIGSNPLVSVIMNCYNGEKFLRESLNSVIEQSYQNWELIFWDNCSTDGSASIFKSFKDKRFKYFSGRSNVTLGQARNLALREASGEFIAFLDCDDLWLPEKLSKQIPLFNRQEVGLVICDTIFFNDKREIKQLYKKNKPRTGMVFRELLGSYFISLETVVLRSSVLNTIEEWFDDRFHVIEEYDFFTRVALHWELAYVDAILAKWRVHPNSDTWKKFYLFPIETRMFVDKLFELDPNFSANFNLEIKKVMKKVETEEAMVAWMGGDGLNGVSSLVKYAFKDAKIFALLILVLFVPFKVFEPLYNLRRGLY